MNTLHPKLQALFLHLTKHNYENYTYSIKDGRILLTGSQRDRDIGNWAWRKRVALFGCEMGWELIGDSVETHWYFQCGQ